MEELMNLFSQSKQHTTFPSENVLTQDAKSFDELMSIYWKNAE